MQIFMLIVLIVLVILFILLMALNSALKNPNNRYIQKYNLSVNNQKKARKNKVYDFLANKPVFSRYLKNVRDRLYLVHSTMDEYSLKFRSIMLISFSLFITALICGVLIFLYKKNIYVIFIIISCGYIFNQVFLDMIIGTSDVKVLNSLVTYIKNLNHAYHSTKTIEKSFEIANLKCSDNYMENHGKRIHDILTCAYPDNEMYLYNTSCPNKFLKLLAGFSLLIKKYGDEEVDGISVYIKNLHFMIESIQLEILKSNRLTNWLKGLLLITLIPILLMPLFENWAGGLFPKLFEFYNSSYGFYLKVICVFLSIITYIGIKIIKSSDFNSDKSINKDKNIFFRLCKVEPFKTIVSYFTPKKGSRRFKKYYFKLESAGSPYTVDVIIMQRIIWALSTFVVALLVFICAHNINIERIVNDATYKISSINTMFAKSNTSSEDFENRKNETLDTDNFMITDLEQQNLNSKDEMKNYVKEKLTGGNHDYENVDIAAERIVNKFLDLKKEHLRLFEFLIVILLSVLTTYIPLISLSFQASLRKTNMEEEVFTYNTIIMILMHHEKANVLLVLEWMREFSNIFKNQIDTCITNFQNPKHALQQLKEDVKYMPFVNMIENFEISIDKINLKDAFDTLEIERSFYKDSRKEAINEIVSKKIHLAQLIGFIPLNAVIMLYLAMPLLIVSISSIDVLNEGLKMIQH